MGTEALRGFEARRGAKPSHSPQPRIVARAGLAKIGTGEVSPLFEIALVLVRLDHVASRIVNAHHSIM